MKADQCTASTTLESLRGKRACSTGYRKTAGWRMPIGRLLKDGVMDEVIHLLVARSRWGSSRVVLAPLPPIDVALLLSTRVVVRARGTV